MIDSTYYDGGVGSSFGIFISFFFSSYGLSVLASSLS
jgi:hypothetical protein